MLFYLDLNDQDLSAIQADTLTAAVGDLLRARRLGYHLVVMSRRSSNWIRENINLNAREAAMLNRIEQEYTQTGGLRRLADIYVNLSANPGLNLTTNGNAITVFLGQLAQYKLLDRTVLLIEDIESDGGLYQFLLHNHCSLHGCAHVSYDLRHGGGENLPKVFEHEINEWRIVFGIVDSDKNSPLTSNRKLLALRSVAERRAWPLAFVGSPPCREAENIVPFAVVMTLPSGNRNSSNRILSQVARSEAVAGHASEERYLLFFDLKEGLIVEKFSKLPEEERAWIEGKLNLAGVDPYNQGLTGYGDKLIRQIFEQNEFASELRRMTQQNSWRTVFASFIETLVWPFAAGARIIT